MALSTTLPATRDMRLHRRKNQLFDRANHIACDRLGRTISGDNPRLLGVARHERADSRLPPEAGTNICARPGRQVRTFLLRSHPLVAANDRHIEGELNLVLTAPLNFWTPAIAQCVSDGSSNRCPDPLKPRRRSAGAISSFIVRANAS
jgi:hypothetical protein